MTEIDRNKLQRFLNLSVLIPITYLAKLIPSESTVPHLSCFFERGHSFGLIRFAAGSVRIVSKMKSDHSADN